MPKASKLHTLTGRRCWSIAAVTAAIFLLPLPAQAGGRYLVRQSNSSDCGPAALATLLTYYLGVPASEAEMMRVTGSNQHIGSTLLGLERGAVAEGCTADSYRMTFATLRRQLTAFPLPVIVRTLLPEPHFSLVLATDDSYVYIADPALGNIIMSHHEFLKRWYIPTVPVTPEGYVFVAAEPTGSWLPEHLSAVLADLGRELSNLRASRPPMAIFRH